MKTKTLKLYERDYNLWLERTAFLLKKGRYSAFLIGNCFRYYNTPHLIVRSVDRDISCSNLTTFFSVLWH